MAPLNYCVECGGALSEKWVAAESRNRLVCTNCGYIHYQNPKVVAATLPVIEGKVLLIRRGIEPAFGAWSYPAGYVEMGETVEEAAQRETREETYLEVRLARLLNVYSRRQAGVVVVAYLAEAVSGEPRPGAEVLDVGLFAPDEIPWTDLAFPTVTAALRDWLDALRQQSPEPA